MNRQSQLAGGPLQDRQAQPAVFYGRRRLVPVLMFFVFIGVYAGIAGEKIVPSVFGLALSAWLCVTAWQCWRRPVPSPREARRHQQRRAWLGAHPAYGALLNGLVLVAVLFLSQWPTKHLAIGLVICSAAGALIGLGLFFVFRSDPDFKPTDEVRS